MAANAPDSSGNNAQFLTAGDHSRDAGIESAEVAALRHAPAPPMRLQPAFNVLIGVEEQVKFADQKAAFLATLHSFLISALAGNAIYIRLLARHWEPGAIAVLVVCFSVYALTFLAAMYCVALTVLPRIRQTGRPPSRAFFGRIAASFGDDADAYVAELRAMSEDDWFTEVGRYVADASVIAVNKHRMVRRATYLTIPAVLGWVATVLALLFAGSTPSSGPGFSTPPNVSTPSVAPR